jgi:hypothetical protein
MSKNTKYFTFLYHNASNKKIQSCIKHKKIVFETPLHNYFDLLLRTSDKVYILIANIDEKIINGIVKLTKYKHNKLKFKLKTKIEINCDELISWTKFDYCCFGLLRPDGERLPIPEYDAELTLLNGDNEAKLFEKLKGTIKAIYEWRKKQSQVNNDERIAPNTPTTNNHIKVNGTNTNNNYNTNTINTNNIYDNNNNKSAHRSNSHHKNKTNKQNSGLNNNLFMYQMFNCEQMCIAMKQQSEINSGANVNSFLPLSMFNYIKNEQQTISNNSNIVNNVSGNMNRNNNGNYSLETNETNKYITLFDHLLYNEDDNNDIYFDMRDIDKYNELDQKLNKGKKQGTINDY